MTIDLGRAPFHTGPGEGTAVWHLGALLTFKATTEATAGRFWVKELLAPRGMAVPRHVHTHEDEAFYVLDGEVGMHIGDDVIHAGTGSFLWGPEGSRTHSASSPRPRRCSSSAHPAASIASSSTPGHPPPHTPRHRRPPTHPTSTPSSPRPASTASTSSGRPQPRRLADTGDHGTSKAEADEGAAMPHEADYLIARSSLCSLFREFHAA